MYVVRAAIAGSAASRPKAEARPGAEVKNDSREQAMRLSEMAPAGHYLALRVGFAFPMEEHNELPRPWVNHYIRAGLMLVDPLMKWIYQNYGVVRWNAVDLPDPAGVLDQAKAFGLPYGAVACCTDRSQSGLRSFGLFARADREFTDGELAELFGELYRLHVSKTPPANLTRAELEALRMVRDGMLLKEIAAALEVSESAVQQRLKNARTKLNASTNSHAIALAAGFGLI